MEYDYDTITSLSKLWTGEWKGVMYTNDVTINYFNFLNKLRRFHLSHTRDIVRPITPIFFFNKNSILTEMFNRKIEKCRESGLIYHWIAQYKQKHKTDKNREPRTLGIQNILAIVQISMFLYFIAFIIFILEIISYKHARIRKLLDFLTF